MTVRLCSRRQMLAAGFAAGAVLTAGLPTGPAALTGCTSAAPTTLDQRDPLRDAAERAESDAALAQAVAAAHPELAGTGEVLAADRRAHAAALHAELRRDQSELVPPRPGSLSAVPTPVVGGLSAARDALAGALRAAQVEATGLVTTLPAHRAALMAAVAACCASHTAVLP